MTRLKRCANRPFVALESVTASKAKLVAKLRIDVELAAGVKRKIVSVKRNDEDLYELSGQREIYRGYVVTEINAEGGFVTFGNGVTLPRGAAVPGFWDPRRRPERPDLSRIQSIRFLTELPSRTDPAEVTVICAMALIFSFLATLYPALKAASTDPVQVLRYE